MWIEKDSFETWMERIMDKLDTLENRIREKEKERHRFEGELLLDNQDVCIMLNISKRTLQRYRSSKKLPYKRIAQKTYYMESDVNRFLKEHLR